MLSPKQIMYISYAFFIASFCCLIIEGFYYNSWFVGIVNSLTGFNIVQISSAGMWAFPKVAWGFITHGIPLLISWDFSFFSGGWIFWRFLFIMTLSVGVVWGFIQTFLPVAQGILSRFTGGASNRPLSCFKRANFWLYRRYSVRLKVWSVASAISAASCWHFLLTGQIPQPGTPSSSQHLVQARASSRTSGSSVSGSTPSL